jgi:hypothetical protein
MRTATPDQVQQFRDLMAGHQLDCSGAAGLLDVHRSTVAAWLLDPDAKRYSPMPAYRIEQLRAALAKLATKATKRRQRAA